MLPSDFLMSVSPGLPGSIEVDGSYAHPGPYIENHADDTFITSSYLQFNEIVKISTKRLTVCIISIINVAYAINQGTI